jgi:parallel beta-helix repeat protein
MSKDLTRFASIFFFIIAVLLVPHSIMAATFVGSCQPGSYPTISAAVGAATAGAIIKVCPGTYPEQVVIGTSLTLEGITSGNASRAVITVPGSGFATTITEVTHGDTVTPQVLVTVPGVNISNITVDGTGASISTKWFAGIFYESGSSGIIKGVTTRNQTAAMGAGIWAENGTSTSESVTIENSSVHDANELGIYVASNQTPPTLTATVLRNHVVTSSFVSIGNYNANASITSNVVTVTGGGAYGIAMVNNSVGSITSNTVSNAYYGILVYVGSPTSQSSSIKSNLVLNSIYYGVWIEGANNATVESNTIVQGPVGIEFQCSAGLGSNTVKNNTISDVTIGLDSVPSSVVSPNIYDNVDTIRTGACGFAPTAPPLPPLP